MAGIIILKQYAKAMTDVTKVDRGQRKGKRFHEINEEKNKSMDDLANQVQSLFYHNVHFNSINTRMYTEIECKTPGVKSKQTFKVNTWANGNLMPITMFAKLFPRVSLDELARTIESAVTLYAYNNTPIKQFVMCSVHLSFKRKAKICRFFIVEHNTAILGINDSERLGLVRVNFNAVKHSAKLVHEITSDSLRKQIESEYPELFKGIGLMDGEISIKLKECAIPHVEPVRHVPHAMKEPLKKDLDKLVDEKILH